MNRCESSGFSGASRNRRARALPLTISLAWVRKLRELNREAMAALSRGRQPTDRLESFETRRCGVAEGEPENKGGGRLFGQPAADGFAFGEITLAEFHDATIGVVIEQHGGGG